MKSFTKKDIRNLITDLELYSGNIKEVTDVYGPTPHGLRYIGGTIHTWMDAFAFMALPHECTEHAWCIQLANPVESLRRGHRSIVYFRFPKIHQNKDLAKRYQIANLLYKAYNATSDMSEQRRLPDYEVLLGYEDLPSYSSVISEIITEYRSYQEDLLETEKRKIMNN